MYIFRSVYRLAGDSRGALLIKIQIVSTVPGSLVASILGEAIKLPNLLTQGGAEILTSSN